MSGVAGRCGAPRRPGERCVHCELCMSGTWGVTHSNDRLAPDRPSGQHRTVTEAAGRLRAAQGYR